MTPKDVATSGGVGPHRVIGRRSGLSAHQCLIRVGPPGGQADRPKEEIATCFAHPV